MGLRDILIGRASVKQPAARERLFALSTAYVTLETSYEITTAGVAGIVVQALATSDFQSVLKDTEEVVKATAGEFNATVETPRRRVRLPLGDRPRRPRSRISSWRSTASRARSRPAATASALLCAVFAFKDADGRPDQLHLQLQARQLVPVRPGPRRQAAQHRARAAAEGADRRRAADRARARALVPAVGRSVLRRRTAADGAPAAAPLARATDRDALRGAQRRLRGDGRTSRRRSSPARRSDIVLELIEARLRALRLRDLGGRGARRRRPSSASPGSRVVPLRRAPSPRRSRSAGGCSPQAWGHGYATEAATAALGYGFGPGELTEIVSFTTPANGRSIAVMRRLGMTPRRAERLQAPADAHAEHRAPPSRASTGIAREAWRAWRDARQRPLSPGSGPRR